MVLSYVSKREVNVTEKNQGVQLEKNDWNVLHF